MSSTLEKKLPEPKVEAEELAPGTALLHGQYRVESFLSSGGFGITYLARDSLDRRVVIKECFPRSFCRRIEDLVVTRPGLPREDFRSLVRNFIQEARHLARLDHPNIVGVHQVFEDNGTAYMALDYVEGRELFDLIADDPAARRPEVIETLLRTLLDTIDFVHSQGVLHRDISPDNILIRKDMSPVLIDFGAARAGANVSDRVRTALLAVKDGYSPQELYITGSAHKPSCDIYALAATFYHLIAGEAPPNCQERLAAVAAGSADPIVPIASRVTRHDRRFLEALDIALAVFPKDRFQTAAAWKGHIRARLEPDAETSISLALARRREALASVTGPKRVPPKPAEPHLKLVMTEPPEEPTLVLGEAPEAPRVRTRKPVTRTPVAPLPETAGPSVPRAAAPVAEPEPTTPERPATAPTAEAVAMERRSGLPGVAVLAGGVAALALVAGLGSLWFGGSGDTAAPPLETATVAAAAAPLPDAGSVVPDAPVAPADPSEAIVAARAPLEEPAAAAPEAVAPDARAPVISAAGPSGPRVMPEVPPAREAGLPGADVAPAIEPGAPRGATVRLSPTAMPALPERAGMPEVAAVAPAMARRAEAREDVQPIAVTDAVDRAPLRLVAGISASAADAAPGADVEPPAPLPVLSAAATETGAAVFDARPVMTGWSVMLPFETRAATDTVVARLRPGAPDWMAPGQVISSVNGVPVSTLEEIGRVIRAAGTPGSDGTWPVALGVVEPGARNGTLRRVALPAMRHTVLLNGMRFETAATGDGRWRTVVTESPFADPDGLMTGDEIVGFLPTNETIDGSATLPAILVRELASGLARFDFAVRRDDALWVVSLDYRVGALN